MTQKAKKIWIASDHAGVELKAAIQRLLPNFFWEDLGPADSQRVDYPDYAEKLANEVAKSPTTQGVLICGSGIGMCITANKVRGVRAAVVENTESARLARQHNDANVICLGARFLAPEYASEIIRIFLETPFSGDARHQQRIDKISRLERK